jgi:hypothetical protein
MSPPFSTKVDTPNLNTGPSMLVWTYHLSTLICVTSTTVVTRLSVTTLPKIKHRRIYLFCSVYHNVQWNRRRLYETKNSGISALLNGNADLSWRDRSITRQFFLVFGLIGCSKFLFYSDRISEVTRRYPGKPDEDIKEELDCTFNAERLIKTSRSKPFKN